LADHEKGPGRNRGPMIKTRKPAAYLSLRCFSAVPRISAQRRPGIGGAVLRDGFLLLGDFQRLIETCTLRAFLSKLDHPRIDLFADGETLGALIGALARPVRTA